jgi:hypothetical protein
MLKFPLARDFDVIVFVTGGEPELTITFAEGERAEEIPRPMRLVTGYLDTGIEDVVLREADSLGKTLKQLPNLGMTLRASDSFSLPNAVVGEDSDDPVLVMIVITDIAIFGLQLLDRFDILESDDVFFEFGAIHSCGSFCMMLPLLLVAAPRPIGRRILLRPA